MQLQKLSDKKRQKICDFVRPLPKLHDIYRAAVPADYKIVKKKFRFCDSFFKVLYLSEFLSPRDIKNIC